MTHVADQPQKTSLTRTLRVGEEVTMDNGRIVIRLEAQSGRRARLQLLLDRNVVVDKPPKK